MFQNWRLTLPPYDPVACQRIVFFTGDTAERCFRFGILQYNAAHKIYYDLGSFQVNTANTVFFLKGNGIFGPKEVR